MVTGQTLCRARYRFSKTGGSNSEYRGQKVAQLFNLLNQILSTGIYFIISHKQFFRPDSTYDKVDAVYPDVEVYRKIYDIINNKDTQMEKIIQLIKKQ
jgi:hypothetical protein